MKTLFNQSSENLPLYFMWIFLLVIRMVLRMLSLTNCCERLWDFWMEIVCHWTLISLISIHEFVLITNSSGSDCHTFSSVVYFGLRGNTKWLSMILPRKEYLPNTSCTPLYEKPQRNFIVCHKWSTYSYFLASKQCVCALH